MNRVIAILSGLALCLCGQLSRAELVTALTNSNVLVNFDTATPGTTSAVNVTGLLGGDFLSGIDSRPANGALFGFAVNGTTGRLYSIDRATGAASLQSTISTALSGNFFGVDFNPTVDRLRIVSDTGQNLRVNVDTGAALVDGALQFAAGDPNVGTTPQVVAAAYSNNFGNAVSTTLYTLDLATQSLLTQAPPNAGTLNTIGSLSGILFPEAAFDISGMTGLAYAVLNGFELVQVDLTSGATSSLGAINAPGSIVGFAAPSVTAVPEPGSALLVALGSAAWIGIRRSSSSRQRSVAPRSPGNE